MNQHQSTTTLIKFILDVAAAPHPTLHPIHRKFNNEIESDVVSLRCTEEYGLYIRRAMTLCQLFYRLYQAPEQSEIGAVWKVVEDDSVTDDEESSVVKAEEGLVEDDLVEDFRSEAVHRLPCLSPLSNVHTDLSPCKL